MQPSNAEDDAEFEAFRPALVVSGLQKRLASMALAAGRAYVGLNDGGLLVLAPVPSSGTDSDVAPLHADSPASLVLCLPRSD